MSGRRSRNKGARVERAIVQALQADGFAATRVPLSGAAGGRFAGDVMPAVLRWLKPNQTEKEQTRDQRQQ